MSCFLTRTLYRNLVWFVIDLLYIPKRAMLAPTQTQSAQKEMLNNDGDDHLINIYDKICIIVSIV